MLSIIVPALNEEVRIAQTVETIRIATQAAGITPYEVIIVNDGSTDKTAEEIALLEKCYPFVSSIHFSANEGIGAAFLAGVRAAKYDKVSTFPGDNCCRPEIMYKLFRKASDADLVLSYLVNTELRAPIRRVLSFIYSHIYILSFHLPIKYMNGSPIYPTKRLLNLDLKSRRYGIFAEINVKLIRQGGITFAEVPDFVKPNQTKTSAIRLKNLMETARTYLRLFWEVHFLYSQRYYGKSERVLLEFDPPPLFEGKYQQTALTKNLRENDDAAQSNHHTYHSESKTQPSANPLEAQQQELPN